MAFKSIEPSPEAITDAEASDDLTFLTFNDLKARRIVGSRAGLHYMQKTEGFPLPVRCGQRALFIPREVRAFIFARIAKRQNLK